MSRGGPVHKVHRMTGKFTAGVRDSLVIDPKRNAQKWGYAPMCHLCMKPLSSEEIVETTRTTAKVLVRHHGAEELHTFDMQKAMNWETDEATNDLAQRMGHRKWFDPENFVGGQKPEHNDGVDAELYE